MLLPLALAPAGAEEAAVPPDGRLEALVARFAADEGALRRFYAEPLASLRLERLGTFLDSWSETLAEVPYEALGVEGCIDYALLTNQIASRRDELALQAQRNAETVALIGGVTDLIELDRGRWRPATAPDSRRMAAALEAIRERLRVARARVEQVHAKAPDLPADAPRVTPVIAFRASRDLERLSELLADWFGFHESFEPSFAWWTKEPYDALRKEIGAYATHLRDKVAGATGPDAALIGDPIGRDALVNALAREYVPYSPEALLTIAQEEFSWCEAEGLKAAAELKAKDWNDAVALVKALHRDPGSQAAMVVEQAQEAVAFLQERDLLTIPPLCAETWRLRMLGQKQQETLPFAVYNDQHMLVAYATAGMAHESKLMSMRGNNEHFTRIVTPHELIPGHHLQLFQAARHRAYRELFRTAFLVEGWALHWEMLLWDLGWARGPEDRIGLLFWRKHRCARIIVTLMFHLGRMQPNEMIAFLTDRVGLERDGATSEVRRYIGSAYGPLYQCAYMVGGLQLRALHHELVGNGHMSQREFHDAVLEQGSVPIEFIRAALHGTRLPRGYQASWRWRGDVAEAECPR